MFTVHLTITRRDMVADLVPVDIPINLAIAVAWKISSQTSNAIPVYNCVSSSSNPVTWGTLETIGVASIRKYPFENALWYPGATWKESAWAQKISEV